MIKRIISICIVVLFVCNIYGCVQTAKDAPAAESETEEIEDDAGLRRIFYQMGK